MAIKLYVVYHKEIALATDINLFPIRSDRTDGVHIAEKVDYSELRAHYWIWKNTSGGPKDYVGIFHYRRYLDAEYGRILELPCKRRPIPYRITQNPGTTAYWPEKLLPLISDYDAIAPVWEYTGLSVTKRYGLAGDQRTEDLDLICEIIAERCPEYLPAANTYCSGKGEYYGNLLIMRRPLFDDYCGWLFDLLGEFDRRAVDPPPRSNGHLGERLFGIYFTWFQQQSGIRCGEIPRVHFSKYDDNLHSFSKQRLINVILPPGSKRRAAIRKIAYRKR